MGIEVRLKKKVERFSLDVSWRAGSELVALFGFSGSGKTMTLRLIAGLMRPDSGCVRVAGRTYYDGAAGIDLKPRRRRLGFVFQEYALFPHMSVEGNIAFGLAGVPGPERRHRVGEMLERFHLGGLGRARPAEISGGQRQRVALARALVGRPGLLILDEPFSALDRPIRLQMREVVREIRLEFDIPIVLVTHDFSEVESLADRVMVYSSGRVVQSGAPERIANAPAGEEVRRLLGKLPGSAEEGNAENCHPERSEGSVFSGGGEGLSPCRADLIKTENR